MMKKIKRWSYGSDTSIEAIDNSQNRLCCSPVDEFDSTVSSENEELIINNTDERNESYKDYLQTSPASSPTFKDAACSDNGNDRSENNDVDTADDELIDYSKRYTTDTSSLAITQQQRNVAPTAPRRVPEKKSVKVDPYGDYAETDLDQPTDYSLRYAEEDTDEEEKEDNPQFYCTRGQEDTTKTYYTEGTPYETPCNFSASTSISDLLSLEDNKEAPEVTYKRQFLKEKQEKMTNPDKSSKDNQVKLKKKYAYEDTKIPVLLKTAETNVEVSCNVELKKLVTPLQSPTELCDKEKESKTVSLNSEENDAQQTPLMFSRCSSLDSLNEFDQRSIHDDHSSVVSDFSHRTSTVVSPSELPDSPTQTVPPSPRRLKQQSFQEPSSRVPIRPVIRKPPSREHQENNKLQIVNNVLHRPDPTYVKSNHQINHCSVFEDGLVSFGSALIPSKAHSIAGSSLSALTIDDDDAVDECDSRDIMNRIAAIRVRTSAAGMHKASMQNQPQLYKVVNKHSDCRNNPVFSPPIREEVRYINLEDKNIGQFVYVNKESPHKRSRDSLKDPWRDNRVKNNNQNYLNESLSSSLVTRRQCEFIFSTKPDIDEIITVDSTRIYCTEDTPTFISPFGSQSNLSALSMLSISDENLAYYANSEDDESPRTFYSEGRSSGQLNDYDTDSSASLSEDDFKGCVDKRIDVSPFDSQVNLDSLALLRIEEEDEEDEEEVATSKETDKLTRDDYRAEDIYEESEEDHKVLEDCIKSGLRKVTRKRDEQ
ncbi:adenomatous polyposis coli homolog isoform X2 [Phymastichus coffea]|uniref:adenomatous polyposis coli homolog isoform X2 n=1 Tax=Phymastichus coffea TaxID=108790 RepID=UPI00273CE1DE|nr:adenomatous polyposis coli homolog isoform X2 [Phymastichus coffea]